MTQRHLLRTRANPQPRHDYLDELADTLTDGTRITVRYVPDGEVLDPAAAKIYFGQQSAPDLETLVLDVLDDLLNELVPRWVEVSGERKASPTQRVTVRDRQPTWNNPDVFSHNVSSPL